MTRQELLTAFNTTNNTIRLSDSAWILETFLQEQTPLECLEYHSKLRAQGQRMTIMKDKIYIKLPAVDDGFNFLSVSPEYIPEDINGVVAIEKNLVIQEYATKEDLAAAAEPLINFKPKLTKPVDIKMMPEEVCHANITHDLLDALSYELQGINSSTGKLHDMKNGDLEKLINNRLFCADIHLPKCNAQDKIELGSIIASVKNRLKIDDFVSVGAYIDKNLPKLVIARRWWAL